MKFGIDKRIQQERFLGAEMKFNPIGFTVSDCDSKEEAEKAVDEWIIEYFTRKQKALKENADLPFIGNEFANEVKLKK